MEDAETIQIRLLEESDPPDIAAAFAVLAASRQP